MKILELNTGLFPDARTVSAALRQMEPVHHVESIDLAACLRRPDLEDGTWDRATLDRFLAAPQVFAPGTQMTLGGVRNAADRAAVIDYLETLR